MKWWLVAAALVFLPVGGCSVDAPLAVVAGNDAAVVVDLSIVLPDAAQQPVPDLSPEWTYDGSFWLPDDGGLCYYERIRFEPWGPPVGPGDPCEGFLVACVPSMEAAKRIEAIGGFKCELDLDCAYMCSWMWNDSKINDERYRAACAVSALPFDLLTTCWHLL